MINCEREITKEQYERAMANNRYITDDDSLDVFTITELRGYGVYGDQVFQREGKFFVRYKTGDICD